jgi:16S rRNA (cytosine967-C5)-methyltransferase
LLSNARRVISGDVTSTAAFRERRIAIQDESSQLVAALVGKGERILDCCAAPGGKTSAIAERNPQAEIVAAELHPQRARLMRELVTAKNVEVKLADVTKFDTAASFDRVLADVPCSGTGTLARNPEIKWRLKLEDLSDLHRRQVAILSAAIERASIGARIVYSTCSLEKEEDEDVVEEVLRGRRDIQLLNIKDLLVELRNNGALAWNDLDSLIRGNFLRTLPGVHPCDGFFAAAFEKISD